MDLPGQNPQPDKKKIFVDEDWKSQVQREKEQLAKAQESGPSAPGAAAPGQSPAGGQRPATLGDESEQLEALPPPTLTELFSMLGTQALIALGQFAPPGSEQVEVRLEEAKHFIDMIEMLVGKTSGNRTPEESQLLDRLLYDLRMGYVAIQQQVTRTPKG